MRNQIKKNKNQYIMATFVMLALIGSVSGAQIIDLTGDIEENYIQDEYNVYTPFVNPINEHTAIKYVARNYDKINIVINDTIEYDYMLDFNETHLEKIYINQNETCDTQIRIQRDDLDYLILNWENMNSYQKIRFVFDNVDIRIKDILTFGAIAISNENE